MPRLTSSLENLYTPRVDNFGKWVPTVCTVELLDARPNNIIMFAVYRSWINRSIRHGLGALIGSALVTHDIILRSITHMSEDCCEVVFGIGTIDGKLVVAI